MKVTSDMVMSAKAYCRTVLAQVREWETGQISAGTCSYRLRQLASARRRVLVRRRATTPDLFTAVPPAQ